MLLQSWTTWLAAVIASVQLSTAPNEPICNQLAEHIGPSQVAHLNAQRPDGAPSFMQVCAQVLKEARRQKFDPAVAAAVAYAESGMRWRPPGKAFWGPMQVGRRWCEDREQACVPDGVKHLRYWRSMSSGWKGTLWGYVGGHTKNLTEKQLSHKRSYVKKVTNLIRILSPHRSPPKVGSPPEVELNAGARQALR